MMLEKAGLASFPNVRGVDGIPVADVCVPST